MGISWDWQDDAFCRTIDLAKVPRIATLEPVDPDDDECEEMCEIPEVLEHIPDIFYVEDWEEEKVERAKGYCAQCPVRDHCLDFALGTRESEGIWGGTTGNERRSLMNRRRKAGDHVPNYTKEMQQGRR